jgi:hypothetical protein
VPPRAALREDAAVTEEAAMTPIDPTAAALDEAKREEARRQAEANGGSGVADGLDAAVDLASSGALEAAGQVAGAVIDAAGAALGATADVAQASLEVVGGILGGLGSLDL